MGNLRHYTADNSGFPNVLINELSRVFKSQTLVLSTHGDTFGPQTHLYAAETFRRQTFWYFHFCCHGAWKPSTDERTQLEQHNATWCKKTPVTANSPSIIILLNPNYGRFVLRKCEIVCAGNNVMISQTRFACFFFLYVVLLEQAAMSCCYVIQLRKPREAPQGTEAE